MELNKSIELICSLSWLKNKRCRDVFFDPRKMNTLNADEIEEVLNDIKIMQELGISNIEPFQSALRDRLFELNERDQEDFVVSSTEQRYFINCQGMGWNSCRYKF